MVIDIDKIIVKDRIRKDFGDIQELADDIQQNGLINPPVINKEYVLLAGERRLRACKLLGWNQIEVRMMDTRDAEHELNVEISENDVRKGFSKAERVDYMKRLLRIEQAKAKERMESGKAADPTQTFAEGESRKIVAEQFGVSHETMRKEVAIADNRELLDPSDFADWDEGKLSTNKAFQKLKAAQFEAERKLAEKDRKIFELENRQAEIEVREITKNIVPADYDSIKQKAKQADALRKDFNRERELNTKKSREISELQDEVKRLKEKTVREKDGEDLNASAVLFAARCRNFLENVGGYVFVAEHLSELDERERHGYIVSAKAISDWATILLNTIERNTDGIFGSYRE